MGMQGGGSNFYQARLQHASLQNNHDRPLRECLVLYLMEKSHQNRGLDLILIGQMHSVNQLTSRKTSSCYIYCPK